MTDKQLFQTPSVASPTVDHAVALALGAGPLGHSDLGALAQVLRETAGPSGRSLTTYVAEAGGSVPAGFALWLADPDEGVLEIPAGDWPNLGVQTIPAGARKEVRCAPGARLLQTTAARWLDLRNAPAWTSTVTSFDLVDGVNLADPGETATSNLVTRLTLPAARTVAKGDLVKIFSDDLIPGSKSDGGGDRMEGEWAVVGVASTGAQITLTAPLAVKYLTNARVALMPRASFCWRGGVMDVDASIIDAVGFRPFFDLRGLIEPTVTGVRCERLIGTGINWRGCWGYLSFDNHYRNAANRVSLSQLGYAEIDSSSEGGRILGCSFVNVRHPVDTSVQSSPAGTGSPENYGRTRRLTVAFNEAIGCQNGFGTHNEADGVEFVHCTVKAFFAGASSGGAGFTLRGRNVVVRDCVVEGSRGAVQVNCMEGGRVDGLVARRVYLFGASVNGSDSSYAQDTRAYFTRMDITLEPSATSAAPFLANPSDDQLEAGKRLYIEFGPEVIFRVAADQLDCQRGMDLTAAIVTGTGPTFDLTRLVSPQDMVRYAAPADAIGAGYAVNDLLTVVGGVFSRPARLKVLSTDSSGGVVKVEVNDGGDYSSLPSGAVAVTGGAGAGATFAITGATGFNVIWQGTYDDSQVTFQRGRGLKVFGGAAGQGFVNALWSGSADGVNTPFGNAHVFPDCYYEGFHDLGSAYGANPSGQYDYRWPNVRHSIRKVVRGKESSSAYMEVAVSEGLKLPLENRLDLAATVRLQGSNYAGCTLALLDRTKLHPEFELTLINSSAGFVTYSGRKIPPGHSVTLRWASSGAVLTKSRTWSRPGRIAGIRTNSYTTSASHLDGVQQIAMVDAVRTITLHKTAGIFSRIYFTNRNGNAWSFAAESGAALVNPEGGSPAFTKAAAIAGGELYAEVIDNADGNSARWALFGNVAP